MMSGRIALEHFGPSRPDGEGALDAGMDLSSAAQDADHPGGPADAGIDPEAERLACLARIADALEVVAAEQAGLRAQCTGDAFAALGAAAETLLPRLARTGFAALVAETAQTIARRGQWPVLQLSVAPDNAEAVAGALGETGPVTEIKITADAALGPGEAQLGWSQGGAEIDIEAIAEAALGRFRQALDACVQQGA